MVVARVTDDRLTVRCRHVGGAPVVAVRAWVRGGSRLEPTSGQALIAGRLLTEGTARRSWRQIAEAAEGRGMAMSSFGDLELGGISIDGLAADWELAIEWAAESLLESSFPEDRCAWAVRQACGELAALADHPDASTSWAFLDQLYAPHPAGRPPQGDVESLARLDAGACRRFHELAGAGGVIVTIAGAIDPEAAESRAREAFAAFAGRRTEATPPPEPAGREPRREHPVGGDQAHVFVGRLSVARSHPALPALRVLSVILGAGGGLSGRIPYRVREREGLAYATHVDTAAGAGLDRGRFVAYVGTSPGRADHAIGCVLDELRRLLADGVTDDEVDEAKSFLLGREPFRRETARQWADLMAAAAHYELPIDDPAWVIERLGAVDRAQVESAAREFIDPDDLKITVGIPRTGS